MMEFLQNFHFLRPWCLLFLLLPLGFYLKNIGIRNYVSSWENICDKNLLNFLLVTDGNKKRISIKKYIYTGIIAAVIGAAGPSWKKMEVPTFVIENPTMFILSLSRDMQLTDISPSRLERAKFMVSDIADLLTEGPFGLEVYSQEPYLITPLSDDAKIIKNLMPQIVPNIVPDQGNRLDRAIGLAIQRFAAAGYTNGNIIIFASDPGQQLDLTFEKIKEAVKHGYTINIVDTSFSENETMRDLAKKGNGIYISVREPTPQKIVQNILKTNQDKVALSQNLRSVFLDYGYYLVFVALLCLLPFFRRGLLILVLCCGAVFDAEASFFLNDNQEGLKLFKKAQYERAFEKFNDHLWKGLSLYKQDKNEEALKEFSQSDSDVAFYNSGVVLAKMCEYEKALKAFNEALKVNPDNVDAKYNKKVLEELFEKSKTEPEVLNCGEQQNQQQQNNDKNKDNKQNHDQNQQQNDNNQNQNQNNDNENKDNNENSQSDNSDKNDQNNNEQNSQNEQQNNNSNADSNQNNEQNQNQQNSDNNEQEQNFQKESDENNEQNSQNNDSSQQQDQNKSDQSNKKNDQNNNSEQNKGDDNSSATSDEDVNNKDAQTEKGNTPSEANKDSGDEQKSKNKEGQDNNATEMQEEEVESQVMNMKKGDENTKYDEEALAMQRRYREIPEDPGGLLREFIRKEYMKDRYHE